MRRAEAETVCPVPDRAAADWRDPALDARLLAAHARDDRGALIALYAEAADRAASHDADASGFYRTHAYVFALEAGDARAARLRAQLAAEGREA